MCFGGGLIMIRVASSSARLAGFSPIGPRQPPTKYLLDISSPPLAPNPPSIAPICAIPIMMGYTRSWDSTWALQKPQK